MSDYYKAFQKSVAFLRQAEHLDDIDQEMLAAADRIAELEQEKNHWVEQTTKAAKDALDAKCRIRELEARLDAIKDIMRSSSFMHPRDALSRIYAALGGEDE